LNTNNLFELGGIAVMFGWVKRRAQIAIIKSFDQDIDRFISGLKGMSAQEVAGIVVFAAHWRNALEEGFGWDLDHPDFVAVQDIGAATRLNRMIRDVQKQEPVMAAGLMVWLHSVWAELERGMDYAYSAAVDLRALGLQLNTKGLDRMPQNLLPDRDGPITASSRAS
jgi:hypothetical protein